MVTEKCNCQQRPEKFLFFCFVFFKHTGDCFLTRLCLFGLRKGPAIFQRLMNKVLSGFAGCAAYLGDVLLYSSKWSDHVQHLEALFECLVETNLTMQSITV